MHQEKKQYYSVTVAMQDVLVFLHATSQHTDTTIYRKHSPTHTHEEEGFAQTTWSALSQRGLLDSIKPEYHQSRLDGWLQLTAGTFNLVRISMRAVLVTVPTVMQKSLHPLSTSSTISRHLLDFMVQGKITEADELIIRLDATPSGLSVPPHPSSAILHQMPFLQQPCIFIMEHYTDDAR